GQLPDAAHAPARPLAAAPPPLRRRPAARRALRGHPVPPQRAGQPVWTADDLFPAPDPHRAPPKHGGLHLWTRGCPSALERSGRVDVAGRPRLGAPPFPLAARAL